MILRGMLLEKIKNGKMFILITENFIEIEYNDKEYLEKTSKDLSDTYVQKALFQNKKNKIWKLILWPL